MGTVGRQSNEATRAFEREVLKFLLYYLTSPVPTFA